MVLVYDCKPDGHRANYVAVLSALVDGSPLIAPLGPAFPRLVGARCLLLTTFETAPRAYTVLLLLRALLGRRTAIVFMRAHLILRAGPAAGALRYYTLRLIQHLPRLALFTIVPIDKQPPGRPFATIADPEFWDFLGQPPPPPTPLSRQAIRHAGGRPILLFAGYVELDRGIAFLAELAARGIEPAIVVCGTVLPDAHASVATLEQAGAMIVGRFVTDEELVSLLGCAQYIWCCFTPERDMSSGLFGRALQVGALPVVRRSSILDALAFKFRVPVIRLDYGDVSAAGAIHGAGQPIDAATVSEMREATRRALIEGLALVDHAAI